MLSSVDLLRKSVSLIDMGFMHSKGFRLERHLYLCVHDRSRFASDLFHHGSGGSQLLS